MAQFKVNPKRFDPYKNFKFRVKCGGRYVAGFSKCSPLKRPAKVVSASGANRLGRREFEAITLERGITQDLEFEKWANKVSLKDFDKDVLLEVYNEAGRLAVTYKVFRCWVSEFQALPDLDANANAVAIQHLKLENEGWERDVEGPEPSENPLQTLLRVIAEQANALADNIQQLYDDQLIETGEDWAVPYISDLIGYPSLREAREKLGKHKCEQLVSAIITELVKRYCDFSATEGAKRKPSKKKTNAHGRSAKSRSKSKRKPK